MAHVCHHKCAVLDAKIGMWEVGQNRNDLILKSERSDQRTHGSTAAEVMKQFQLVLNPNGAARDIDLLQCHESGLLASARFSVDSPSF